MRRAKPSTKRFVSVAAGFPGRSAYTARTESDPSNSTTSGSLNQWPFLPRYRKRTRVPSGSVTDVDRVPLERRRNWCMPGCQPLKSPTTLHPAAASSAANANVTLTLSALRKSLIMPVSLCRGERPHCAGQAPARSPRRAAATTTNRSREGGGVPTALPAARRLNNDDAPDRRPGRPTARTGGVPEVGAETLTSDDRRSDMIPTCRCSWHT